jgi:DNA-binding CsgD family transcriptional regulator
MSEESLCAKSSALNTWRISSSVSSPGIGSGQRFTHSMASSIDFTCQSQKPATSSPVAAKGPSMTSRLLPRKRTRLPPALGCSPSPASRMPAFISSSLYLPISWRSCSLGVTPASEFFVAFTITITRIVSSPGQMQGEAHDLRRTLDVLPIPLALVDGSLKVLCANARAEALLGPQQELSVRHSRLYARRPQESAALEAAARMALHMAEPPTAHAPPTAALPPFVQIAREEKRPLGVTLMPIRPRHRLRAQGHPQARVLVVFHDPEAVARLDDGLVATVHGLTPTEALLAVAIAEGKSLAEFAAARGCSEQTARTHLKRILDKTQARRQADLVRILLSSTALQLVRGG